MKNLTLLLSASLLATTVATQTPLPPPPDLQPGDQYRVLVITNSSRDATSSDIAVYNTFVDNDVNTVPELAALNVEWRAIASTSTVAAKDNTNTQYSAPGVQGVPIYLRNGTRVADNYDDLWDGNLSSSPNVRANGSTYVSRVLTGTLGSGASDPSWPLGNDPATSGRAEFTFNGWTDSFPWPNYAPRPFYALSDVLTVPAPLPHPNDLQPGDSYRVLVVTDSVRDAMSDDIADYDAFVAADALANPSLALLNTTWKAVASTASVDARPHTEIAGSGHLPIYRRDGVRIADSFDDMWGNLLLAPPDVTASGAAPSGTCWTGTDLSGFALEPLGNATGIVRFGNPFSYGVFWIGYLLAPIAEERPLYAISAVITVPAETVRVGNPANANAFLPGQTSAPVIGKTWDPVIDHTTFVTFAALDFAMFGSTQLNVPVVNLGTVLTDQAFGSMSVTPGQPFLVNLPNDAGLVGTQLSVQGLTLSWNWGLHLTNALDITVGTH